MAQGDTASDIVSVSANSTLAVQPPSGESWKVNAAAFDSTDNGEVKVYDGTNASYTGIASSSLSSWHENIGMQAGHGSSTADASVAAVFIDSTYYIRYENLACSSQVAQYSAIQHK